MTSLPDNRFANPKRIGRLDLSGTDKLIAQLSFIKRHLRYPLDRQKFVALFAMLLTVPLPLFLWLFFKRNPQHEFPFWLMMLGLMMFIPAVFNLFRFLQTFRFIAVASQFDAVENELLLIRFFQSCQLRFERHSANPELFWIMSRKLNRDTETREVVIFIVEDKRILINSHFTRPRFISPVGQPHHRELAKTLNKWLDSNRPVTADIVRVTS